MREIEEGRMRNSGVMDLLLMSRLRMLNELDFDSLPDAAEGAGRRLYKALREYTCTHDIAYYAATRPYPFARMRRMLMCAALGISAEFTKQSAPYIRVLAANEKGREHLRTLEKTSVPLVTKPAAIKTMDEDANKVFALGASAHDIYRLQFVTSDDKKAGNDWRMAPVIV